MKRRPRSRDTAELRRHAIAVDTPAFEQLLTDLTRDHTTVLFGESHHFVHETFAIRTRVLDILGQHGYTRLGLELSPHDGRQLDTYLHTGNPDVLDHVGLFGARGTTEAPPQGILADGADLYPHAAMRTETVRWLDHLRRQPTPWSLYGFDIDYLPELATEHLPTPTDPDQRQQLDDSLAASRRYDQAVRNATTYPELTEPMAWREDQMTQHVLADRHRHPHDRNVLIGHNLHISASSHRIHLAGAIGPGGGLTPPLGTQLAQHGITGPTIWIIHDHGHDSGPPPSTGTIHTIPHTLNATLAALGDDPIALPTAHVEPLQQPWRIASMYGSSLTVIPAHACDLIVSAPTTTRLQI
jgi:hypothetical protein